MYEMHIEWYTCAEIPFLFPKYNLNVLTFLAYSTMLENIPMCGCANYDGATCYSTDKSHVGHVWSSLLNSVLTRTP